jgi:hypothetical protein
MPDHVRASLATRVVSLTALSVDRYTLELSPAEPPEKVIQELASHGVHVVSLNPIRTTLEDYFVSTIGAVAPRDTAYSRER